MNVLTSPSPFASRLSSVAFVSAALGCLASAINAAYLINVGVDYDALATTQKRLLVHETTHVWQGKSSKSSGPLYPYIVNDVRKGLA